MVGLELGADDYVTKPFSPRELVLRVRAVLRRASAPCCPPATTTLRLRSCASTPPRMAEHGGGGADADRARVRSAVLPAPPAPGQVFPREHLLSGVWGRGPRVTMAPSPCTCGGCGRRSRSIHAPAPPSQDRLGARVQVLNRDTAPPRLLTPARVWSGAAVALLLATSGRPAAGPLADESARRRPTADRLVFGGLAGTLSLGGRLADLARRRPGERAEPAHQGVPQCRGRQSGSAAQRLHHRPSDVSLDHARSAAADHDVAV